MKSIAEKRPSTALDGEADSFPFKVHSRHTGKSIASVETLSTRARNVLAALGAERLGDLQRVSFKRIAALPNCGPKTLEEIRLLSETFRQAEPRPRLEKISAPASGEELIHVPPAASAWPVDHLPFSIRLRHTLARFGCRRLGELDRRSFAALRKTPDCGRRTLNELRSFLERVQSGKYGAGRERKGRTPAAFLVLRLDHYIEGLNEQRRSMLLDRTGGRGEPVTLMTLGAKHNMTRERVRQIIDILVEDARRHGGPPFVECLEILRGELERGVRPLTPALLDQWMGPHRNRHRFEGAFYIRFLGWMEPRLPVWPINQTPAAYRTAEQERVIGRMKEWFAGRDRPVTTAQFYAGVTAGGFRCTVPEFLEALRFAAEFGVDLKDPASPRVEPPIAAPRRWARQVLASAEHSPAPPELLARARAFLFSRRSSTSRYRLAVHIPA